MGDLIAAFGLALAIEGLVCAAFPEGMRRALEEASKSPADRIRLVGIGSALLGVVIVWGARALLR